MPEIFDVDINPSNIIHLREKGFHWEGIKLAFMRNGIGQLIFYYLVSDIYGCSYFHISMVCCILPITLPLCL